MSEIKVDTLTGKTSAGDVTITSEGGSATMQLQQGLCKTWIKYTDQVSALESADDFNVSSIADTDTGKVTVNFINNMSSIDFCFNVLAHDMASRILGYSGYIADETSTHITTSKLLVWTGYANNTNGGIGTVDSDIAMVTIHGDLA
mgnify:CR=1 FL=1|jgi:hypothetical protein